MYGAIFFQASAHRLLNKLQNHIKLAGTKDIFSKNLKIYLFKLELYN